MRGRREAVVRFELYHRPHRDAHRRQRLFERMELSHQRAVHALAGLVRRIKIVAKRLDDVIRRDANVRRAGLGHLQHRVEDADDRPERRVLTLVEAAQPVEVAKELVGAVDEVDDHAPNARVKLPTAGGPEPMPSSCLKKT